MREVFVQPLCQISPAKSRTASFPHDFSGNPVRGSAFNRYFKTTAAFICALRARLNGWIPAKIMREWRSENFVGCNKRSALHRMCWRSAHFLKNTAQCAKTAYYALRATVWNIMEDLLTEIELLQNLLIDRATGGSNEHDGEYKRLRKLFLEHSELASSVPQFVRSSLNLAQFWSFIKPKHDNYQERRTYLYNEFEPLINRIEFGNVTSPSDKLVSNIIKKLDSAYIQAEWAKALERRLTDPEAAITTARTLIEATCRLRPYNAVNWASCSELK